MEVTKAEPQTTGETSETTIETSIDCKRVSEAPVGDGIEWIGGGDALEDKFSRLFPQKKQMKTYSSLVLQKGFYHRENF